MAWKIYLFIYKRNIILKDGNARAKAKPYKRA
jgi:hypothetical protein